MPANTQSARDADTALVTGAAGFTGLALARSLAARGQRVRGLVRSRDRALPLEQAGIDSLGAIDDRMSLLGGQRQGGMAARFKFLWLAIFGVVAAAILMTFLFGNRVLRGHAREQVRRDFQRLKQLGYNEPPKDWKTWEEAACKASDPGSNKYGWAFRHDASNFASSARSLRSSSAACSISAK